MNWIDSIREDLKEFSHAGRKHRSAELTEKTGVNGWLDVSLRQDEP